MRFYGIAALGLVLLAGAAPAPVQTGHVARDPLAVLVQRLAALRRELPRESCDLYALAGSARTDDELCTWVREKIGFAPYAGFQRGAAGTLASGCGNAADRALLLATLLRTRGVDAQLVRGPQPGAPPPTRPANLPVRTADETQLLALAAAAGVDVERLRGAPAEAAVLAAALQTRVDRRFRRDLTAVLAALEGHVPAPSGGKAPEPGSHWWVRTPAGDLDPTLDRGVAQGGTPVAVDALPADACQTLRVQCKLRVAEAAEDTLLLDVTLRSIDVFGDALALGVLPVDGTALVAELQDPTPGTVMAALAKSRAFQPQVGTPQHTYSGRVFDLAGNVLPLTDGRVTAAKDVGSRVGGLFGGIAAEDRAKPPPTEIAECWFELDLAAPGTPPAHVRRDLLRPGMTEAQRVFDLLATRQVLVAAEGFGDDWLTDRYIGYVQDIAAMARAQLGGEPARLADWRQASRFPLELHMFVAARSRALPRLQDGYSGASLLHSQPLVIAQVTRFIEDVRPRMETGFDILHNDVVDLGPAPKTWAAALPLAAGILDTALEHEVRESGPKAVNTSVLLERAMLAGKELRLATPEDLPPAAAAELSTEEVACVSFPGQPTAWYRVDRISGSALGLVGYGGGQDLSEYGVVADCAVQLQEAISFYRDMMLCVGIAVTSPLAGENGRVDFENCVWNLICGKILDAATVGLEVETTWTNVLVKKAVSETWNSVCEQLANKAGFGKKPR